jgi:hypothetical protein
MMIVITKYQIVGAFWIIAANVFLQMKHVARLEFVFHEITYLKRGRIGLLSFPPLATRHAPTISFIKPLSIFHSYECIKGVYAETVSGNNS